MKRTNLTPAQKATRQEWVVDAISQALNAVVANDRERAIRELLSAKSNAEAVLLGSAY